ncbi:hypothetical protein BDV11DRAFT_216856 [Aspergillus similis]
MAGTRCQIISAPSDEPPCGTISIFLAGTTSKVDAGDWREQVEWELDKQDKADVVVIYFHHATQAPISLLELGICARVPRKAIVVCPEGYWKRGNVQIVCKKFDIEMVDDVNRLKAAIVKRLPDPS